MFLESFRHLIEIEALKRENLQNHQRILSETNRISDLEQRRKKTTALSEELKIEEKNLKLNETQHQIEDLQLRQTRLSSQLQMASNEKEQLAFENQIEGIKADIENLENLYFEKLDRSEQILTQVSDHQSFLKGSEATLEEIKKEVAEEVKKEELIIENRTKRIQSLLEFCHPTVKNIYLDVEKRFTPKSAVSFLIDKKCTGCHMQLDSLMKASIDEGRSIELCPHCSRLLIPETARVY